MPKQSTMLSHLYIRIDRPLRAALVDAAQTAGLTISGLARRELRKALGAPAGKHDWFMAEMDAKTGSAA